MAARAKVFLKQNITVQECRVEVSKAVKMLWEKLVKLIRKLTGHTFYMALN